MPINVMSGGPSLTPSTLPPAPRGTMGEMMAAIADELDDTNNEYLTQIQAAIFAAIRHVEREKFYFNQDGALAAIETIDAPHPWFVEAFDLIKARATYELHKNIVRDANQAASAFNDFIEQMQLLRVETSRRTASGKITATLF